MKLEPSSQAAITQRAFTLIEVMIAAVIVMMIAVSLWAGLSFDFVVLRTARENLRATQILTQRMEAIRLLTWSQLSNCPASFQDSYYPSGITNNTVGVIYQGTITVATPDSIPDTAPYKSQMRLITASISWTNYNGGQPIIHTRQMQSQVACLGMQNYVWGVRL
jgi:prepilin-type N-terminal cleavage/methylation domain-containing protein